MLVADRRHDVPHRRSGATATPPTRSRSRWRRAVAPPGTPPAAADTAHSARSNSPPPAVTYRGTHSGGGEVCLTLTHGLLRRHVVSRSTTRRATVCIARSSTRPATSTPPLLIADARLRARRRGARSTGSSDGERTVQAQLTDPAGASRCTAGIVRWTATHDRRRRRGCTRSPTRRRPRCAARRDRCSARCARPHRRARQLPAEACTARASATVAGVRRSESADGRTPARRRAVARAAPRRCASPRRASRARDPRGPLRPRRRQRSGRTISGRRGRDDGRAGRLRAAARRELNGV